MRDYPNMSYCMFTNTADAMRQILEAIEDNPDFLEDLSREERAKYAQLVDYSSIFLEYVESTV